MGDCRRRCDEVRRRPRSMPGQDPEPLYGAVNVPIYQNATYAAGGGRLAEGLGLRARREPDARGLRSRRSPPSRAASAASRSPAGSAAETTLLLTLRPGDHVVLGDDVYGGTYRLLVEGARAVGAHVRHL